MNIYVASSWRNDHQPSVVEMLRVVGHDVYDFRNPAEGVGGFSWSEIDPEWKSWTPQQYREALKHLTARNGFFYDMQALRECDACVLVLPSGRSASWEFGWACGHGKRGTVYMPEACEPELMYADYPIQTTMSELVTWAVQLSRHRVHAAE